MTLPDHSDNPIPSSLYEWFFDNQQRIKVAFANGTLPYFISQNADLNDVAELLQSRTFDNVDTFIRYNTNRRIYHRLLNDENYKNVKFDLASGGVKAQHVSHNLTRAADLLRMGRRREITSFLKTSTQEELVIAAPN